MTPTLQITMRDTATPTIRAMLDRADPQQVASIAGRAGVNVTRSWLRAHNAAHPNKFGGKRTNFFAKAAAACGYDAEPGNATIYTQAVGVLHARYGGEVRPSGRISSVTGKPIRHLAIPARAEAHGKLPSEFDNLAPWFARRDGKPTVIGLQERASQDIVPDRRSGRSGFRPAPDRETRRGWQGRRGGGVMFWLVESVIHQPNEAVLPPADLVLDSVRLNVLDFLTRRARDARFVRGLPTGGAS